MGRRDCQIIGKIINQNRSLSSSAAKNSLITKRASAITLLVRTIRFFHYAKANKHHIDEALKCAKAHEKEWAATTRRTPEPSSCTESRRNCESGEANSSESLMIEGGKTISESDPEVSEAIDFAEYYRRQMEKMARH